MSRGLGKIERAILEALEKDASNVSDEDREVGIERNIPLMGTVDLAIAVFGLEALVRTNIRSKYNSLTRALRSLKRKGLAFPITHNGRTCWTDAQGLVDLDELEKEARRGMKAWEEKHGKPWSIESP